MEIKKGKYKHYKGGEYEVVDIVIHSETLENMVLYRQLYGDYKLWVRPIEMWNQIISIEGIEKRRFEFVQD